MTTISHLLSARERDYMQAVRLIENGQMQDNGFLQALAEEIVSLREQSRLQSIFFPPRL